MNWSLSLNRSPTDSPSELLAPRHGWLYRCSVVSRVIAAVCGGYALATVASVFVSRLFGLAPAEAVMTGLLASFPIYAAAIVWCFATRSAARAWVGIIISTVVTGALAWAIGPGGTP